MCNASYEGSEPDFVSAKSVFALTIADLALSLDTLLPSVSVSVFWKPLPTGYIESPVYHIGNEKHYVDWA